MVGETLKMKTEYDSTKSKVLTKTIIDIRGKTLGVDYTDPNILRQKLSLDNNLSEINECMELLVLRLIEDV